MNTTANSIEQHHLLDDKAAAPILGIAPATLKNSRFLKTLNGAPTPAFIRLGRSVRYELGTLLEWRSKHYTPGEAGQGAPK